MPNELSYFLLGIVLCLWVALHVAFHIYAPRMHRYLLAWLYQVSKGRLGRE